MIKQKVQTPKGVYDVLSNQIPGGRTYVATVVYFLMLPGNPQDESDMGTMSFKHHNEFADTEEQVLAALLRWCETTFGRPCRYIPAE
jgi:hypothetical protein